MPNDLPLLFMRDELPPARNEWALVTIDFVLADFDLPISLKNLSNSIQKITFAHFLDQLIGPATASFHCMIKLDNKAGPHI
jgi:hypothetical protein